MQKKHYKLRYLPLFEEDLTNIVEYIAWNLHNPLAAEEFLDDVQKAIRDRLTSSNSFEKFHSAKERLHPYYRIYVKNYVIYYVVIENVMEVRRIIYGKRNVKKHV